MGKQSGHLDIGGLQAEISSKDPRHAQVHQEMVDAINRLATNTAASATGETSAPKAPDAVSVKVAGEFMHISISHSGELNRNIRYFSEISSNPQFSQPIVIDHGSSRTSHPIPLPTFPDGGGSKTNWYVRSYAQYPSSQPSPPTVVGGLVAATAHTMNGTTQMTLLPSSGSGTASNTGQQGSSGLGKVQKRT